MNNIIENKMADREEPKIDNEDKGNESIPKVAETDSSPFLDDNYEDQRKDLTFFERWCGPIKGGSLRGSVFSMASIVFGIAGLAFPLGLVNLGLIPGMIFLLVITGASYWSASLLLSVARQKNQFSYGLLVKECLGTKMGLFSDINNIIFCIGALMGFEFTISSFFMDVFSKFFQVKMSTQIVKLIQVAVSMVALQFPLSCLRNIATLQYASIVGCMGLFYTTILIAIESPGYYKVSTKSIPFFEVVSWRAFESFSIFLYGFASHCGILPIFVELARPSKRRSFKVITAAYLLELGVYLLLGLGGFFSLLVKTPSIFILREDLGGKKDYFIIASKILYIFTLQCSIAINNNMLRNACKGLLYDGKDIPRKWDVLGMFVLLLITNSITFFIDDIMKIIAITGGICSVIQCFLNPILCWINTNGKPYSHYQNVFGFIVLGLTIFFGFGAVSYSLYIDFNGDPYQNK